MTVLNRITPDQVSMEIKDPVDALALEQAKAIMSELMEGEMVGASNLLTVAKRLGDVTPESTAYTVTKEACQKAFEGLSDRERTALVNIHTRVKAFADMQRTSVQDMEMDIPGGKAGHTVSPCKGMYVICVSICFTSLQEDGRCSLCQTMKWSCVCLCG
jgi:histidinol dehydrogenase